MVVVLLEPPPGRGEAPPWPAGVGHGRPPPPMAFLAGGAGMWGVWGRGWREEKGRKAAGPGPAAGVAAAGEPPELLPGRACACAGRQKQRSRGGCFREGKKNERGEGKKRKKEKKGGFVKIV